MTNQQYRTRNEAVGPAAPRSSHRHPECAVGVIELRARSLLLQRLDLLFQGDVLENKIGPRPKSHSKPSDKESDEQEEKFGHGRAD